MTEKDMGTRDFEQESAQDSAQESGELEEIDEEFLSMLREITPTPPDSIKRNVMLAVSADAKLKRRNRLVKMLGGAAAAIVLLVGVGIAIASGGISSGMDSADDCRPPASGGASIGECDSAADGENIFNGVAGDENKPGENPDRLPENTLGGTGAAQEFSYKKDYEYYKNDAGAHFDGFVNVSASRVEDAKGALARAKNECTVDYDATKTYYDADADVWKVLFYTGRLDGGCQTVYIGGDGITLMIVYGE